MALAIGVCRVKLRLPENHSLKGKRSIVRTIKARIRNKFNVSAAEIDDQDSWQIASLGIACVSNDDRHADEVMASVIAFIRNERLDAEILDVETEVVRGWE